MTGWAVDFAGDAARVVLGWALGLGSAVIVDWRRRSRKATAAKRAILREFDELAYRLVPVVFKVEARRGRLDRKTLQWLRDVTGRYDGPNLQNSLPTGFSEILKATDEHLETARALLAAQTKPSFFPAEQVPYASAMVSQAHVLDTDFTARVMDIVSHVRMYNEIRDSGLHYTHMTFDSGLDESNHARVVENADNADDQLSKRARVIVDKVAAIQDDFGAK